MEANPQSKKDQSVSLIGLLQLHYCCRGSACGYLLGSEQQLELETEITSELELEVELEVELAFASASFASASCQAATRAASSSAEGCCSMHFRHRFRKRRVYPPYTIGLPLGYLHCQLLGMAGAGATVEAYRHYSSRKRKCISRNMHIVQSHHQGKQKPTLWGDNLIHQAFGCHTNTKTN